MRTPERIALIAVSAISMAGTAGAQNKELNALDTMPESDTAEVETPAVTAFRASDVRVVISVEDRRLWVLLRGDTVHSAPVAVASGRDFSYAGRRWRFATPRGELRVRGKRTDPVWLPPDWHYAEVAKQHGMKLRQLPRTGATIKDGWRLVVRDSVVGVIVPGDSTFQPLPVEEHIVFDNTLFIPPVGSRNRHLTGELGRYSLDMGNGYMLHGTPDETTIGTDSTHGCIRLADADLEWLYLRIPVGAVVQVK